jgi:peptide deformylase
MILPIKTYGAEVLRQKANNVTVFNEELKRLADNMVETMYHAPGIGLAAPQVGVSLRLITVDVSHGELNDKLYKIANPEVLEVSAETDRCEEGCLSVPGFSEAVVRPLWAKFSGQDLDGCSFVLEAEALLARCILHEIDHLNGILFVDRLAPFRRRLLRQRLKKQFGALSVPEFQPTL